MNWAAIYLVSIIVAGVGGAWFGMDYKEKQYAAEELARKSGWADALDASAREIAKIKVVNKNITTQAETVIREKTVLQECKNPPEMVTLINKAAKGTDK